MPKILLNVSEGQKVLWVGAAHDARLSLSEWIRRRCDAGLEAGAAEKAYRVADSPEGHSTGASASSPVSSVPAQVREVRVFRGPDPRGGLAAGEVAAPRRGSGGRAAETPPAPAATSCPADAPAGTRCKLCGKKH